MLEGQILEPGEFPWQDTEAQMVGQEAKAMLAAAVSGVTTNELDQTLAAMTAVAHELGKQQKEEEEDATGMGEPKEEHEGDVGSADPGLNDQPTEPERPQSIFNRRRIQRHE